MILANAQMNVLEAGMVGREMIGCAQQQSVANEVLQTIVALDAWANDIASRMEEKLAPILLMPKLKQEALGPEEDREYPQLFASMRGNLESTRNALHRINDTLSRVAL